MKRFTVLLLILDYLSAEELKNPIYNYGRWCGPGHGGYQDCCNSTYCPSCGPGPKLGQYNFTLNTQCLKECPPVDDLDLACAQHDTCCFLFGSSCGTFLNDEHCFCNALLSQLACHYHPYNKVCLVFSPTNHGLGCWACNARPTRSNSPSDTPTNHLCINEHYVEEYGPNLTTALQILVEFNRTGKTQFKYFSSIYKENCIANTSSLFNRRYR